MGWFRLANLPKKRKREVKFEETISIDENRILTVIVVENSKGIKKTKKIINDKGFN